MKPNQLLTKLERSISLWFYTTIAICSICSPILVEALSVKIILVALAIGMLYCYRLAKVCCRDYRQKEQSNLLITLEDISLVRNLRSLGFLFLVVYCVWFGVLSFYGF